MCDEGNYSVYTFELVRNNGNSDRNDNQNGASFLMFDYFDVLYCKELRDADKKYLNYFSIKNVFEDTSHKNDNLFYKVSSKTLSLYRKSDNESNIFEIKEEGTYLSETPFIGLIQISLRKENYIIKKQKEIDVNEFLTRWENEILSIADAYRQSKKTMRQMFRSSTTGDFCLVIRTDSIKDIYDVAIALNGTQNLPKNGNSVKLLTYTNVGIECRQLAEGGYATLQKKFAAKCQDITIALRFSGDKAIRFNLQNYLEKNNQKENRKIEVLKGLFGRYEYLMYISMEEYADIYPLMCEKKLGKSSSCLSTRKRDLAKILDSSCVRDINERVLVELKDKVTHGRKNGQEYEKDKEAVKNKNNELSKKIGDLSIKWRDYFQEEHFAFQDLLRGMWEIYNAFSSAGMEEDAYINWLMFHEDMDILCDCINQMMQYYKEWEQKDGSGIKKIVKKEYRKQLLQSWRVNLQAINQYTKLIQNVNYQTYQSPIYEIQTQIDAEKAMVAYREAMELYTDSSAWEDVKEKDMAELKPIIYPDLSKDRVEVIAPFISTSLEQVVSKRQIVCTVPSFEYFGRLYDLLPWIMHESSHHIRILSRKERNDFVIGYIFSYLFKVVLDEAFRDLSDDDFYFNSGRVERILIESMSKLAKDKFFLSMDGDNVTAEKCNFQMLMFQLDDYLKEFFPYNSGYEGRVHKKKEAELKERLFEFWLDVYRKEMILDNENLDMILKIRKEVKREEEEKLAEQLLKQYFENVRSGNKKISKKYAINLLDLCLTSEQFDERLKDCVEELEIHQDKAAVRDYEYRVREIFRVMKIDVDKAEKESKDVVLNDFLKEVFLDFQKRYKTEIVGNDIDTDPVVMHIMRNVGLLDYNETVFQEKMREVFRNVDYKSLMVYKSDRKKIYTETFADLLMATSLGFTSFGYCRQVLQTVSDAKLSERDYRYEDINYERFRIVAAVLLAEEEAKLVESPEISEIKIDASRLIEQGRIYCEYTFRCIAGKLKQDKRISKEQKELLNKLLNKMNREVGQHLEKWEEYAVKKGLLYIFLYGGEQADEKTRKIWKEYESVAEFCSQYKYNFWRIECFCRGLGNIVQNGFIYVPSGIYFHMKEIRSKIKKKNVRNRDNVIGCLWEKEWKCIMESKRDVGEFYNQPKQVHEKTPEQKLENAIEFIQNYYYHNRFRMMEGKIGD